VRGEAFGSAGMVTAGTGARHRHDPLRRGGIHVDTARSDTDLLHAAYAGEITAFVEAVRTGGAVARCRARRARTALEIALAAIESVETGCGCDIGTL
jgi:myo-inositol 2-dehydrogenase/D-chiro-inositol 1-dehydrogenase